MSGKTPSLVFIPGSWHEPTCYQKVMDRLTKQYNIECIGVTLPSVQDNPQATFKDDVDAAREAVTSQTSQGRHVIVIAHSYGGMVGNSVIKGLTKPDGGSKSVTDIDSSKHQSAAAEPTSSPKTMTATRTGYVKALILIASGFTFTGLAFMDPFFGHPPPSWRVNKETGYAELVVDPREFFYHDVSPPEEADYWVSQLKTQSLKALFEGGEHSYAGWQDVPNWYIGTAQDRGLPVVAQRMAVGMARGQGAVVNHIELDTSHSPFLSMPDEVVQIILQAVRYVAADGEAELERKDEDGKHSLSDRVDDTVEAKYSKTYAGIVVPTVKLFAPTTWFKFGLPLLFGRLLGWGIFGFLRIRRLWRRAQLNQI